MGRLHGAGVIDLDRDWPYIIATVIAVVSILGVIFGMAPEPV